MTPAILIISALTLLVSGYLYGVAAGEPVWRMNMLSYSYWLLIALAFICSVVVLLNVPFIGYDPGFSADHFRGESDPRLRVWVIVMWMFLAIPIGGVLCNAVYGGRKRMRDIVTRFRATPTQAGMGMTGRGLYALMFVATALCIAFNVYVMPKDTALMSILSGQGVLNAKIVRREANFQSGVVVLGLLLNLGTLQLLNLTAFVMAFSTRQRRWWLLSSLGFIAGIFFAVSTGTVTDTLIYLVAIGMARSVVGGPFVRIRELIVASLVVAVLFAVFKGSRGNLLQILAYNVTSRAFYSQLFGTYLAFDVFPKHHPFIGFGSTARILHNVIGAPFTDSYGLILMRFYDPVGVEAGWEGHLTTIFMGEAWANFGVAGVVLAPLWVGFFVQAVNRWMMSRPRTALRLGIYVYLTITFAYARDFIEFYYPLGTASLIVGALVLLYALKALLVSRPRVTSQEAPALSSVSP